MAAEMFHLAGRQIVEATGLRRAPPRPKLEDPRLGPVTARSIRVDNVKRFTVCIVAGHKWGRIAYQPHEGDRGCFLRCSCCGKEMHDLQMHGPGIGDWGWGRG